MTGKQGHTSRVAGGGRQFQIANLDIYFPIIPNEDLDF